MEHKGERMAGVLSCTFISFKVTSSHSAYARMLKKQSKTNVFWL